MSFEETLDAAQEYMALQEALGGALRAGFLSLAQARYSMGADRVSALQIPAHMAATARLRTEEGRLELVRDAPNSLPRAHAGSANRPGQAAAAAGESAAKGSSSAGSRSSENSVSCTAADVAESPGRAGGGTAGAGAAPSSSGGQAATDEPESVAEVLQRMRLAAQQSDSLVDQLAAKYCSGAEGGTPDSPAAGAAPTSASGGGELDGEYAEVAHPSRPLHWFGSLVAPSLRDAEGHFWQALQLAVQAANAQAALRRGLERQRAAAGGGGAAGTTSAAQAPA